MGRVNGHRPATLSNRDERLLGWFLCEGQIMFERSSMGSQLDRAQMYAYALDAGSLKRVRSRRVRDIRLRSSTGPGYDARPGVEPRQPNTAGPDDDARTRFADLGRRLLAVSRVHTEAATVLELYYGDRGARYAGGRPGAIFAVYICTRAGQELLRRDRNGAQVNLELADHLRLENQAAQEWGRSVLNPPQIPAHKRQRARPHSLRWRQLLLDAAQLQSRQLLADAAGIWNSIGSE